MKKINTTLLTICIMITGFYSFAQKTNITDAAMRMKKYNPRGGDAAKKLVNESKEFIDKAAVNPETAENMKMHYYRGMIYFALSELATIDAMLGKEVDTKAIEEYANVSKESFIKVVQDESKKGYKKEVKSFIDMRVNQAWDMGLGAYEQKNYEMALQAFMTAYGVKQFINEEYEDAKLNAMVLFPIVADSLIRVEELSKAEELTSAANDVFPNTLEILYRFINIYLKNGDNVKVEKYTQQALDIDNGNKQLYFILGVNYQQAGNFEKSEENYLKMLSIDSVDEQAHSNLASLYTEKARENYKSGNIDKSQEYYNKSIPSLRFLNRIDPDNYVYVQILLDALYMSNNSKDGDEFLSHIENEYNTRIEEIDKMIAQDKNESNITQVVDLYSNLSELYTVSLTGGDEKKELIIENKKKSIMSKAIPYMIEIHNLNPDDKSLMMEIARAYSAVKDFEKRNFWLKKSKE